MLNHCLLYSTYFKINFYWSSIALQSYFSFCCTAKWLYVYIYSLFFRFLFLLKSPQSIGQRSLSYTIRSHQLSLLYISSVHVSILNIFVLDKVVDGIVYITYIPAPPQLWIYFYYLLRNWCLKFPSVSSFGSFSSCFVCFEALLLDIWIFMTCLPAELSL